MTNKLTIYAIDRFVICAFVDAWDSHMHLGIAIPGPLLSIWGLGTKEISRFQDPE